MSELQVSERLQPSLLDRLTDNNPSEASERREDRVIDLRQLREIIQRDLVWLLNTRDNQGLIDPARFPNAAKSVLNFGIHEVAGDYSTKDRADAIRKSIANAIRVFEPRILPGSVDVQLRADKAERETLVSFDIRADMWAHPMPMELYLRSEVDVTTGELKLDRIA